MARGGGRDRDRDRALSGKVPPDVAVLEARRAIGGRLGATLEKVGKVWRKLKKVGKPPELQGKRLMPSSIDRFLSLATRRLRWPGGDAARARVVRVLAACTVAFAIGGCMFGTPAAVSDVRYDLGPATKAPASADPVPMVRLFEVRAPRALDSDAILYRLSYVDPHRTAIYTHSHWTMPPALLLTQRLREALVTQGRVSAGGEVAAVPLLTVELDQFEQVFDREGESHGALMARATLTRGGQLLAERTFVARAPAETANAEGGVGALSAASDEFVAQLIAWLGMQNPVAAR
jgi:cholesterol transport system auxiliary component